jgi:uncharacterized protein DUF6966
MTSLASDLDQLTADLNRLQQLLAKSGGGGWVSILQGIATRLWQPDTRAQALKELKEYFGGMGSLNDVYFCEENKNIPTGYTAEAAQQELNALLDRTFRGVSIFGGSAAERSEWAEWEASSGLPPRIQNAFRKRT